MIFIKIFIFKEDIKIKDQWKNNLNKVHKSNLKILRCIILDNKLNNLHKIKITKI